MAILKDLIVNGVSRFIGKIYASGGIVGDLEGTASNASKINGHSVNADVPSDAKFTDTWRGIQDNLTSDSATESLSAKQGKALKSDIDTVKKLTNLSASSNGFINDTLWVSLSDPYNEVNMSKVVGTSETPTNLPSDCVWGIREVLYADPDKIVVKINGYDASNQKTGIWLNAFTNGDWNGWNRVAYTSDVYTKSEINKKFGFNYLYGYLQSDVALVNLADENYHKLPMSKSDNSRGDYIQLSDDGTYLTFLKSGLVDFTAMISITSTNDIYAQFCVAKITTSGELNNRFGREIRMPSAQDHGGETVRRIIHVDAGDKVCLTFYMPTWVGGGSPQGTIKANSPTNSTGLMGQYVLYD